MRSLINWLRQNRRYLLPGVAATVIAAALAVVVGVATKPGATPSPAVSRPSQSTAAGAPKIELVLLAKGLPDTTAIAAHPGDQRLFVLGRSGVIRIVDQDGTVVKTPFLDIRSRVQASGEMGLLGMAFSPSYKTDGYFYINYVDNDQNTVIARYHTKDADTADPASEQKILTLAQPYANHNGGDLVFGADGFLYVPLGDGGSGGDPENRSQNLNTLLGKILRLDVSELPYKIPSSNPFAGQAGKRGEIWDYGLRNPWRISFDRQTKELYIADVGQGDIEEINVEPAGSKGGNNYGWRCYEGSRDFNLEGCEARGSYIFPVLEYDHSESRCSVTGGYVYRGQKYPALVGKYFYGDFCGGQLYFAEKKEDKWQPTLVARSGYQISTFGEDSRGELYLADFGSGSIYQVVDSAN